MKVKSETIFSYLLVFVGLINLIGFLVQNKVVRGVGISSVASPLPLVFSTYKGLETFSLKFVLHWENKNGEKFNKEINSKEYSKYSAAYNLRNVYGAVISYGPKLEGPKQKEAVQNVLEYGFCNSGPLAHSLELGEIRRAAIHIYPKAKGDTNKYKLQVNCK